MMMQVPSSSSIVSTVPAQTTTSPSSTAKADPTIIVATVFQPVPGASTTVAIQSVSNLTFTESRSASLQSNQVTIVVTSEVAASTRPTSTAVSQSFQNNQRQPQSLSQKARIGIAVGSVMGLNCVFGGAVALFLYRRRKQNRLTEKSRAFEKPELDATVVKRKLQEIDYPKNLLELAGGDVAELPGERDQREPVELEVKRVVHEVD
jgi:hypothetical protein